MSRFFSNRFSGLTPYLPGEQPQDRGYVKLNTNESPFPPSPMVLEALAAALDTLNLYPDPDTRRSVDAIADKLGLRRENVILANGSDEVLSFCFQAFCDECTPACFADITYGFYPVFADACRVLTRVFPLDDEFRIRPEAYFQAAGTIFIANPNAPTGIALPLSDIRRILDENPDHVVVIDEAYVDFGGESAIGLVPEYNNLVVVQTMSKSRSLAGARIGLAIACEALIRDLNTMKFSFNPYNVNRLSLLAAVAAIRDEGYFRQCVTEICSLRDDTSAALIQRGFTVLPSSANFLFARPNFMSGGEFYKRLKEKGVLVRHFDKPRILDFVRISIGSRPQMNALFTATDDLLEENA